MRLRTLYIVLIFTLCRTHAQNIGNQKPLGKQNQEQSDANEKKFNQEPFFSIFVLQPTPGYTTLEKYVEDEKAVIKQHGYGLIPSQNWHFSLMAFALPFPNKKISETYVQKAVDDLTKIISGYEQDLTDVEFAYKELTSLGTHKFLTAIYERSGQKPFFRVYADIVHDFMQLYPDSWMFYGYGVKPHVSIASKMKTAGAATATEITDLPRKPIKNFLLRHKGRKLQISARYLDPATKKLVQLPANEV